MTDKADTGKKGEAIAADYLEQKGFKIIARNYRYKHSEIDLIARNNNFVIFVEVKTRNSSAYGEPEAFVNSHKAAKILEGAEHYTFVNKWEGNIRFDIVSVKPGNPPEVVHFEDAFY